MIREKKSLFSPKRERDSGIETLKILAMFFIVFSHVTQSLIEANSNFATNYVIDASQASTNIQHLILTWISCAGEQGNAIFFICSAWFLLSNNSVSLKKILAMAGDVWIISFLFLLIFKIGGWYNISSSLVIRGLMPITFDVNWYITCYILFYLIHSALNIMIKNLSQKTLLTMNLISLSMYCGFNWIHPGHFYVNRLVGFIVMYFAIAYIKHYLPNFCNNQKRNTTILIVSFTLLPILIILTNFLGLRISAFSNELRHWGGYLSPLLLLVAIALFNIFKNIHFVNSTVNYISGSSLLIYIIHENNLFRTFIRPSIWIWLHDTFGYKYVILIDILYTISLFLITTIIAILYRLTLQKIVQRITVHLATKIKLIYEPISNKLMSLK